MNHIYQLVWNALRQAWVVVSEVAGVRQSRGASRQGRGLRRPGTMAERGQGPRAGVVPLGAVAASAMALCLGAMLFHTGHASAQPAPTTLPQGGVVTQGTAGIRGGGSAGAPVMNIDQSTQRAVINWNSFNLGSAATVNFNQPGAQAATLNRVLDMNPSQIMGRINAPGQVTLVNPAGVYFTPGAVLDVGALSGRFRYNSDETSTNYTLALSPGVNAVYREAPTVAVTVNDATKVYDGVAFSGGNGINLGAPTLANGDVVGNLAGAITYGGAAQGGVNVTGTPYVLSANVASQLGYAFSYTNGGLSITPAALTLTTGDVTKLYDGGLAAAGNAVLASGTLFGADSLSGGTFAFTNKNVGSGNKTVTTSAVTVNDGNGGANYNVSYAANTTSTINPLAITFSSADVTKVYDGSTFAAGSPLVSAGAMVGGDTFSGGTFVFDNKNVGTGKTVTTSGVTLADGNGGANYAVSFAPNTNSAITAAGLTVTANSDARFVTLADTPGYNGVNYTGFVGGDTQATPGVIGGTLQIDRPNAGVDVAAGTYAGALVPSGLTSGNYTISYANGPYTIVPANQLLIKVTNNNIIYGAAPVFAITSAQYLDGANVIHDLVGTNIGNSFNYNDGATGGVQFTITPQGAGTSGAGKTVVGNFALADAAPTVLGFNFVGPPVFTGNLAVTQKGVAPSASGVSKVFDGTTALTTATMALASKETGDTLLVSGNGAYASKNAGTNLAYDFTSLALAGADAGNYYLSPSGIGHISGTDGIITPAPITVASGNVVKTYDGTTSALGSLVLIGGTLYGGDSLSGGAFAFTNRNAGVGNKTVTASGVTVADGNAGGNYAVTYADNTTSTINRANITLSTGDVTKAFDGTTLAFGRPIVVAGALFGGDTLNGASGSYAYNTPIVGTGKTVTSAGVLINDGNDGANYVVTYADNTNSTITAGVGPGTNPANTVPDFVDTPTVINDSPNGDYNKGTEEGAGTDGASGNVVLARAEGGAAGFSCQGSAHGEPDCEHRDGTGAYVLVTPVRNVTRAVPGQVLVQVSAQSVRLGSFDAPMPQRLTEPLRAVSTQAVMSLANGQPLPAWLSFNAQTLSLAARTMPAGALPLTVLARKGGYEVEMEISSLK